MSRNGYADALENCIGLIDKGMPVEECLLTYPEYAAQLDGPLHVAQTLRISRAQISVPPPTMRRDAFLGAVAEQARADASTPNVTTPVATPSRPWARLRRFAVVPYALPAVLAMLILGGAAWGVSAATGNAGPGSWIAGSSTHDDRVDFRGTITAISPTSVTVSTLDGDVTAAITADTEFEGANDAPALIDDFAAGDFVKLSTLPAADGSLVARELEHEDADDVDDEATPTAGADDADDDNRGPGNAEDGDDDNRGPGNAEDTDDDNSGPGNVEDGDEDNSGPGNAEDGVFPEPTDDDRSGPGGGDEIEPEDEHHGGDDAGGGEDNSGHGGGEEDGGDGDHSGPGN